MTRRLTTAMAATLTAMALAAAASPPGVATTAAAQTSTWGNPAKGGPQCAPSPACTWSPQPAGPPNPVEVNAENTYTDAITAGGKVLAWGQGSLGQLGNGGFTGSPTPVQVGTLTGVTDLQGGDSFGCALDNTGAVWCWGNNSAGMLGQGDTINRDTPVKVPLPHPAVAIAAGGFHAMAALDDGTVWAWGAGTDGELGQGDTSAHHSPVQVRGVAGADVITSGNLFSFAEDTTTGQVWGWGYDAFGQLCNGTTSGGILTPQTIATLQGATMLSAGGNVPQDGHTLVIVSGFPEACGDNASGQLGVPGITVSTIPTPVVGAPSGIVSMSAGGAHSLALTGAGDLYAWGDNTWGQVGDGTTASTATPELVMTGVGTFSAGSEHSAAGPPPASRWRMAR